MIHAHFDCSSGAAGDMIFGALLDAGADRRYVEATLANLNLPGWNLEITTTHRAGLAATDVRVQVEDSGKARSYAEVDAILTNAALQASIRKRARAVLLALAEAEAAVHGIALDQVQLHETGAVDAIVDIVGCCAALDSLKIDHITSSPIATGSGSVRAEHGELPLPAPAVAAILAARGAPLFFRGARELVTPTGAAILATVTDDFGDPPPMRLKRWGHGAGDSELKWANIVRVFVGEVDGETEDQIPSIVLETNIDDMTPELLAHAVDELLEAGARDAWITPIVMKKGRPGFTLSALGNSVDEEALTAVFFRETTTLGIRRTAVTKRALARDWVLTTVEGLPVRVKVGRRNGEVVNLAPEHDDALAVAERTGLPLKEVYRRALHEASPLDKI